MINAFKQIRLSNGVLISGNEGRLNVGNSGSVAFLSEVNELGGSISSLETVVDSLLTGANETALLIEELQSGISQNTDDILNLSGILDTAQSGISDLFENSAFVDQRISDLESGVTEGFTDISSIIDEISGSLEATNLSVSGLSDNVNLISSGLGDVLDTLSIHSGDIDNLKTGLNGALDVLISHHDRLSGIDDAIFDLYSNLGGVDNSVQAFNYPVALGSEDITVLFPSGSFPEIPKVNVTLVSEVGYMFALRNKTVSGFGISFSDTIQENDVSIDVVATIQS